MSEKMSKKKFNWDYEKDEKLIQLVRDRPELYDSKSPFYGDLSLKRKAWNDIKSVLGQSDCQKRWESLRSQFRKNLRKNKLRSSKDYRKWKFHDQISFINSFISTKKRRSQNSKYKEEDSEETEVSDFEENDDYNQNDTAMEEPQEEIEVTPLEIVPRQARTKERMKRSLRILNIQSVKNDETNASINPVIHTSPDPFPFIKKTEESFIDKKNEMIDPMDTFFNLMSATVKSFNPPDQHFLKTKIFLLVNEMEEKYIMQSQSLGDDQRGLINRNSIASDPLQPTELLQVQTSSSSSSIQNQQDFLNSTSY